jgi:RsiW-degrading membrane proteinase PrsW (M82 family)
VFDFSGDISLMPWAVAPPLLFLAYYYLHVLTAPTMLRLLLFFIFGAASGFIALHLEWVFDLVANRFTNWNGLERSLYGIALRQLLEIGPIEESCKMLTVIIPCLFFKRSLQLRASTIFLCTIAIALGFTAEENWIYFANNPDKTSLVMERAIGTPVHPMLSAPWGYIVAISIVPRRPFKGYGKILTTAWLNSVICHAIVNILSSAWRFSLPTSLLSYFFFPFLVWMFWRLQQLLRQVQSKPPVILVSGKTLKQRNFQKGLVLFTLMLGGNAIFSIFLMIRNFMSFEKQQILYSGNFQNITFYLLQSLIYTVIAISIYFYLRYSAKRRGF